AVSVVVGGHHFPERDNARVESSDDRRIGQGVAWIIPVAHDKVIEIPIRSIYKPEHMASRAVALQDCAAGVFRRHANATSRSAIDTVDQQNPSGAGIDTDFKRQSISRP